ncbi:hypothetical protein GGX14DRAFT_545049 [Mycena pura]|uniref:Uncharacterized protein n=1 Tax=Mycena pura TaxID=153505 RepID=A0AAD6V832_9AGAR|nr:hypothetical protein GGX14DRAFT_545049 [Mycena pura]
MSHSSASSSVESFASGVSTSAPKDYAAAFATLQMSYGFSGQAPRVLSRTFKPASKVAPSPRPAAPKAMAMDSPRPIPQKSKSYESAFGALSSEFGTGSDRFEGLIFCPLLSRGPIFGDGTLQAVAICRTARSRQSGKFL